MRIVKNVTVADLSGPYIQSLKAKLRVALTDTCKEITTTAIGYARKDTNPQTVDDIVLKQSIIFQVNDLRGIVYVQPKSENEKSAEDYALVQEYGHPLYPEYGFTPYMRPALQDGKPFLEDAVEKALST
jgi:hypothetical protein